MRRTHTTLALAVLLASPSVSAATATGASIVNPLDQAGALANLDDAPRATYQFVAPEPTSAPLSYAAGDGQVVIYLNGDGGMFYPGKNDARQNTSSLLSDPRLLPAFPGNDEQWNEVVSCVQSQFEGFHVRVTDRDPGQTPHFEAVIGGMPADIGQPKNIGGISPFRLDCGVIDNSVVFVFADLFGDDTERMCNVIAQEVAHSFGLDHEMQCDDPMSYLGGCGEKRFRNADARCGEYEERDCACGQETQNSKLLLAEHLGDAVPPRATVVSPATGSKVNPSFYVDVRADDNVAVERVELYVDGARVASQTQPPFLFEFAGELADGHYQIEARIYDSENEVTQSLDVQVDHSAPMQPPPEIEPRGLKAPTADVVGGCQAGPGTPGGLALVLLTLTAVGLAWPRRRVAPSRRRRAGLRRSRTGRLRRR